MFGRQERLYLGGLGGGDLNPESSGFFMDTASPDVGKEVGSAVLGEGLLPLFGDCASFCCIFGSWRVVAQSAQEARALCSDDGNGNLLDGVPESILGYFLCQGTFGRFFGLCPSIP